jgi:hypothetical protein
MELEDQGFQQVEPASEFEMVDADYRPRRGAVRGAAGGTVWETGLVKLNKNGNDEVKTVAEQSRVPLEHLAFRFGVDLAGGTVAAYAIGLEPGQKAGTVRKGEQYSFHLGGVFKEYPRLRPASKRIQCPVVARIDRKGVPYLLIALSAGTPKIKLKRGTGQASGGEQPAK